MLYLTIAYLLLFTLGINLNYLPNSYDESRIFGVFLSFLSIFFIIKSNFYFKESTILIFLIIILYLIVNFNAFSIFCLQDIVLWMLSFFIFLGLLKVDFDGRMNLYLLLIFVLISVFPVFFIFLSIFSFLYEGGWYSWQFYSGSIRVFDSYIVPVFWLSLFLLKKRILIINKIYLYIGFFIFLALLFNGARSALLSIVFPLSVLWLVDKKNCYLVRNIFFALVSSLFVYKLIYIIRNYMHENDLNIGIYRLSTSFRYEMWMFLFEKWKNNSFLGLGGGFLAETQYQYGHHAHNIWLRLIFEWGWVGVILICFFIHQLYFLFKSKVDPILKMGVFSILIDATFSGSFIYPVSQISCILFMALAFSYMRINLTENKKLTKFLIFIYILFFLYIISCYFWVDLLCVGCESLDGRSAPFFWENGGAKHLQISK